MEEGEREEGEDSERKGEMEREKERRSTFS